MICLSLRGDKSSPSGWSDQTRSRRRSCPVIWQTTWRRSSWWGTEGAGQPWLICVWKGGRVVADSCFVVCGKNNLLVKCRSAASTYCMLLSVLNSGSKFQLNQNWILQLNFNLETSAPDPDRGLYLIYDRRVSKFRCRVTWRKEPRDTNKLFYCIDRN